MLKLIEDDDSDDQMSEAGGDEVNYSNVEFFDDEQMLSVKTSQTIV